MIRDLMDEIDKVDYRKATADNLPNLITKNRDLLIKLLEKYYKNIRKEQQLKKEIQQTVVLNKLRNKAKGNVRFTLFDLK